MNIPFGLSLDGFKPAQSEFNHLFCGPAGLVRALELRLGLATRHVSPAARVVHYLKTTEAFAATNNPFFSESLKVDRWGTAEVLRNMRDELRMAEWSGESGAEAPPKLADLGRMEQQAREDIAPGLADRIVAIRAALASRPLKLGEVVCVDEMKHLPRLIRTLLDDLGARHVPRIMPPGHGKEKSRDTAFVAEVIDWRIFTGEEALQAINHRQLFLLKRLMPTGNAD